MRDTTETKECVCQINIVTAIIDSSTIFTFNNNTAISLELEKNKHKNKNHPPICNSKSETKTHKREQPDAV